jgi:hypothetical protein
MSGFYPNQPGFQGECRVALPDPQITQISQITKNVLHRGQRIPGKMAGNGYGTTNGELMTPTGNHQSSPTYQQQFHLSCITVLLQRTAIPTTTHIRRLTSQVSDLALEP